MTCVDTYRPPSFSNATPHASTFSSLLRHSSFTIPIKWGLIRSLPGVEIPSPSAIDAKALDAIASLLESSDPSDAVTALPSCFNALYSLVDSVAQNDHTRNETLVDALCAGLRSVVAAGEATAGRSAERRVAYKMLIFLLARVVKEAERCDRESGAAAATALDESPTCWSVGGSRVDAIEALTVALDKDATATLWRNSMDADVEVQRLFVEAACAVIDGKRTMASTVKGLSGGAARAHAAQRAAALTLVAAVATMADSATLELATKLAIKIERYEHAGSCVATLCATLGGDSAFVDQLVRKLMEAVTEASKDAALNDRVANFVKSLPPIVVVHGVNKFRAMLDAQSYKLRRAFLDALAEVCVAIAKAKPESEFERFAGNQHAFLDILVTRARSDKNSWVRSECYKLWRDLWDAEAVPTAYHCPLIALVGDGLLNSAAAVRTNAGKFICAMIEDHPYGDTLLGGESAAQMRARCAALHAEKDAKIAAATPVKPKRRGPLREDAAGTPASKAAEIEDLEGDHLEVESSIEAAEDVEEAAKAAMEAEEIVAATIAPEDDRVLLFFTNFCEYADAIEEVVSTALSLLKSESKSDVQLALAVLKVASTHSLAAAAEGRSAMLPLIWRTEEYKKVVLASFHGLYLKGVSAAVAAQNISECVLKATTSELTSLEQIIHHLEPSKKVLDALWSLVSSCSSRSGSDASAMPLARGALCILGMAAAGDATAVLGSGATAKGCEKWMSCMKVLCKGPLKAPSSSTTTPVEWGLLKFACILVQRLDLTTFADPSDKTTRVLNLLSSLCEKVVDGCWAKSITTDEDAKQWYGCAEQALNALFVLNNRSNLESVNRPEEISARIVKKLSTAALEMKSAATAESVSRLFFLVGHISVKILVRAESLQSAARAHSLELSKQSAANADKGAVSSELDAISSQESNEAEIFAHIADQGILFHDQLLGAFCSPIERTVLSMLRSERDAVEADAEVASTSAMRLNESAVLTLCKFMSVSETYCGMKLQLLFTILEKSQQASIRQTVVVALGDLVTRFPSLLDPWVGRIRERLRDPSTSVRKSTLMIMRHLVLNNMVKVHADDIYALALCILDDEASIAGLGRLFISEFAARNVSNIYNILPSCMKKLTTAAPSEVDDAQFKSLATHLASFVEKGWQIESLTEKLCAYLGGSTSAPRESRKLALCLAALKEDTRGVLKLAATFDVYQHALLDEATAKTMMVIVERSVKSLTAESKHRLTVEEWAAKVAAVATNGAVAEGGEAAGAAETDVIAVEGGCAPASSAAAATAIDIADAENATVAAN